MIESRNMETREGRLALSQTKSLAINQLVYWKDSNVDTQSAGLYQIVKIDPIADVEVEGAELSIYISNGQTVIEVFADELYDLVAQYKVRKTYFGLIPYTKTMLLPIKVKEWASVLAVHAIGGKITIANVKSTPVTIIPPSWCI